MKNKVIALLTLSLLAGCSTASKNQRVVNVEQWPTNQSSRHVPSQILQANAQQAKTVCETASMRENVIDYDNSNDTVRIMTVQDSSNSSRVLSEIEIDCRDYFLRKSLASSDANTLNASNVVTEYAPEKRRSTRKKTQRYTYIVQKGDTVWDIAREHCTSVKAISRLNGLGRGNVIDIGQRLKLPDEECD